MAEDTYIDFSLWRETVWVPFLFAPLYDRQEHAGQPAAATVSCGKNVAQLLQRLFAEGRDHYRSPAQKDAGDDHQQKALHAQLTKNGAAQGSPGYISFRLVLFQFSAQ